MPKLARRVTALNMIPEAHRALYVKNPHGSGYVLDVEGADESHALDLAAAIAVAAVKARVRPESIGDVLHLARKHFDVQGKKVIVLDDDGDPTGQSPEKFLATTFRTKHAHFYEGDASSRTGGGTDGAREASDDPSALSPIQKVAAGLAAREK